MRKIKPQLNTVAIVCELNPAHDGHAKLVAAVRQSRPDAAIVAIMSPNFVQRGEPAIFSKQARAVTALDLGFDLVIELPVQFALSSAERFARAGVALAVAVGADTLAFGAEGGDLDALKNAADALNSEECEELTRAELARGASYAAARQAALDAILGDGADVLRSPNNLLGIEYLRAVNHASLRTLSGNPAAPLDFFVIKRESGVTASAERQRIRESGDTSAMLPEHLDVAVLSRLRTMSVADFTQIVGSDDGLAERAARFAPVAATLAELADSIKSKRHAHSRIRRFILAAALGITRDDAIAPQYLRVLAANTPGREVLAQLRNTAPLPIITKPAAASDLLRLEAAATDLYNLAQRDAALRTGGAEWRTSPYFPESE